MVKSMCNFRIISFVVCVVMLSLGCNKGSQKNDSKNGNHLIHESSAYLLQHAHNPVDWYPWGDAALQKASSEKKLMVISIGYSSCHWCHVMERETFSDTAVSRVMNTDFVSIKVDREERPDIDNVYMNACQIMNPDGGCGWPLNAIALPDGRPVWVGTYLNKDEWIGLLKQIIDLYHEDQNDLQKIANQISNHLQSDLRFRLTEEQLEFNEKALLPLHQSLVKNLDMEKGGKKGEIKFPLPPLVRYAMEYHFFSKDPVAMTWSRKTLEQMMMGGIYDQLSGGFARYSTDPEWKVPHFEKMLYDNAQLISVYADAYKINPSLEIQRLMEQNLKFMINEFSNGDGKYFSSFDAESEGEEGKYYIWKMSEIKQVLTDPKELEMATSVFGLTENGNWEKEKNTLRLDKSFTVLAKQANLKPDEFYQKLDLIRAKLLEARKRRISPKRDEKIVCSWNAMTATAFSDAYAATGNESFRGEAIKIAKFIQTELMTGDFQLYRTLSKTKTGQMAFLDDYAATILAFIRIYEITFDETWLNLAKGICEKTLVNFSDEEGVFFYYNAQDHGKLIARKKEIVDQVLPSSNSMMADALHKLGLYFYNSAFLNRSQHMVKGVIDGPGKQDPVFYTNWMRLYLQFVKPPYEVAIVGPEAATLQKQMLARFTPNAILLGGTTEGNLELLKEKLQEGSTYVYVCRNKVCKLPVTRIEEAIRLMQ